MIEAKQLAGDFLGGGAEKMLLTEMKKVIDDGDVAAGFGLEMAEPAAGETPVSVASARPKRSKPPAGKPWPPL
jgi:hypothetical protein